MRCLETDPAARFQTHGGHLRGTRRDMDDTGELIPEPRQLRGRCWRSPSARALLARRHLLRYPAAGSRHRSSAPVSVLVADFENRTGDPTFDGAIEQTLTGALETGVLRDGVPPPDALDRCAAEAEARQSRIDAVDGRG